MKILKITHALFLLLQTKKDVVLQTFWNDPSLLYFKISPSIYSIGFGKHFHFEHPNL
jgi:hypothetical protein